MLSQIIDEIVTDILNDREVDKGKLEVFIGDYNVVDQIIEGISRAILRYKGFYDYE